MKMQVGFSERDVDRREIRAAQKALLLNKLSDDQRALIDACLSKLLRGPAAR